MSKYLIKEYLERNGDFLLKEIFTGQTRTVDIFVDSSFDNSPLKDGMTKEEVDSICKSMIGGILEIDELVPLGYFASGVHYYQKSTTD